MKGLIAILLPLLLLTSCSTSMREAGIASLLAAAQSPEETRENTRQAYESYPDDERVQYNWAYILTEEGEYEEALSVVDRALGQNPTSLRFHYLKANILYTQGFHQSWKNEMEEILSFDSANTDVLLTLAQYEVAHFHDEASRNLALLVLETDSGNSTALSILACFDPFFASIAQPYTIEVHESDWEKEIRIQSADPVAIQNLLADMQKN